MLHDFHHSLRDLDLFGGASAWLTFGFLGVVAQFSDMRWQGWVILTAILGSVAGGAYIYGKDSAAYTGMESRLQASITELGKSMESERWHLRNWITQEVSSINANIERIVKESDQDIADLRTRCQDSRAIINDHTARIQGLEARCISETAAIMERDALLRADLNKLQDAVNQLRAK